MAWSANNAAHRYLWIFCRSLHVDFALQGETPVTFKEGGNWKNAFIIDAPPGAGADVVEQRAKIFATKFNAWMMIERESKYEDSYNKSKAIEEITKAMSVLTAFSVPLAIRLMTYTCAKENNAWVHC